MGAQSILILAIKLNNAVEDTMRGCVEDMGRRIEKEFGMRCFLDIVMQCVGGWLEDIEVDKKTARAWSYQSITCWSVEFPNFLHGVMDPWSKSYWLKAIHSKQNWHSCAPDNRLGGASSLQADFTVVLSLNFCYHVNFAYLLNELPSEHWHSHFCDCSDIKMTFL